MPRELRPVFRARGWTIGDTRRPMTASGAVLDIRTVMDPVSRQGVQKVAENPCDMVELSVGNFSASVKKSPPRVLVIDDEPLIRWSVSESLTELGMEVQQAADAASALRKVTTARLPFQVVVLDLRLPDMRDLSLLATLRQLLPEARLILMTAFGTPEIETDAAVLGASVLHKPFELHDMNRAVLDTPQVRS